AHERMRRSDTSDRILYRSDFDKYVLVANFENRGWIRSTNDEDWQVYWASVHNVRQLFNPDANGGRRLRENQVVNHFPNHYELTRK
ncbi:unnamed protein product, partial [Polarella glacialis]